MRVVTYMVIGALLFAVLGAGVAAVCVATAQPFAAYMGLTSFMLHAGIGSVMGLICWGDVYDKQG